MKENLVSSELFRPFWEMKYFFWETTVGLYSVRKDFCLATLLCSPNIQRIQETVVACTTQPVLPEIPVTPVLLQVSLQPLWPVLISSVHCKVTVVPHFLHFLPTVFTVRHGMCNAVETFLYSSDSFTKWNSSNGFKFAAMTPFSVIRNWVNEMLGKSHKDVWPDVVFKSN